MDNFYKSLKVRENFAIQGVDNPVDKGVNNFSLFPGLEVIHRLSTGYPQGYPQAIRAFKSNVRISFAQCDR